MSGQKCFSCKDLGNVSQDGKFELMSACSY